MWTDRFLIKILMVLLMHEPESLFLVALMGSMWASFYSFASFFFFFLPFSLFPSAFIFIILFIFQVHVDSHSVSCQLQVPLPHL